MASTIKSADLAACLKSFSLVDQPNIKLLARLGTLRQMEIFLRVAELRSLAKAAEKLHLTQPTVSIQVKKLSDAIGLPLYEVVGKKLKLTEAGQKVEEAGREIFEVVRHLDGEINDLKGLQSGNLSISVVTASKYFMPYILAPFCEQYPGVEVEMKIGNRGEIIDRLSKNLDDLYIFSELPDDLDISSSHFLPNPIVVVASKDHPLAGQTGTLRWQDIADERFILREAGSGSLLGISRFLKEHGHSIKDVMTIESNEAIKHAVMANMGISIMSAYILSNADQDGLVQLNVEGFPLMSHWDIVHLEDKKLSSVAQRFLDFIISGGQELLPMREINQKVQSAIDGDWGNHNS